MTDFRQRHTLFSPDRRHRYTLWREFELGNNSYAMFVGLNPSTADEKKNDPTVTRCIDFAKRWQFGALCMTNAFAFRATDPQVMKRESDPVGPDNDEALRVIAAGAGIIIAAWGIHGAHLGRDRAVQQMLGNMHCLRLTKDGRPGHPLYVPASTRPIPFRPTALPAE